MNEYDLFKAMNRCYEYPKNDKQFKKRKTDRHKNRLHRGKWIRIRYQALKKYGKKCAACNNITGPFHVDHIKPKSKYPELMYEISNLQVLCKECNLGKGNIDETDWR